MNDHPEDPQADSETRHEQRYFVSYAGMDRAAAKAICGGLRDAGVDVWFDVDDLALAKGSHWVQALEEALRGCAGYVVVVGASKLWGWVRAEFEFALGRNAWDANFRIVPLLLPGVEPSDLEGFLQLFQAVQLSEISGAPLDQWGNTEFARLASRISSNTYRYDERITPFPGLGYFDEPQSGFYFGRDADVRAVLEPMVGAWSRKRWLQIEGASGAGKSSFARAGLLPAIRRGWLARGLPGDTAWEVVVVRPGIAPLKNLATELFRVLKTSKGQQQTSSELSQRLESHPGSLSAIVRERLLPGQHLVLLVDQLEELFTLSGQLPEAVLPRPPANQQQPTVPPKLDHFAKLLQGLLDDRDLRVTLITTIRSDFTQRMVGIPPFASALNDHAHRYCLPPLRGNDLRPVIEEPARRLGLSVDILANQIIADAGDNAAALPLVAHVLHLLWRKAGQDRLSAEVYESKEFGRLQGALSQSASKLFAEISHTERVQKLFRGLVHVNRDGTVTRHPLPRELARKLAGADQEADDILHRLSGGALQGEPMSPHVRLLVITPDPANPGLELVDVVHEALIHGSKDIASWIERDKKVVQRRGELEHAAERWAEGPPTKSDDGLARGAMLEYYEGAGFTSDERSNYLGDAKASSREYLEAGRRLRRRHRWLQLVVTLGVGLLITVAVWLQLTEADNSEIARKTAQAALHAGSPGQEVAAALAALRAVGKDLRESRTPATLHALSEAAAVAGRIPTLVESQSTQLLGATYSPDERFVLLFGEKGFCELVELESRKRIKLVGHTEVIWSGTFSASGDMIVTASSDGYANIWDVKAAAERIATGHGSLGPKQPLRAGSYLLHAAFSPDGTRVVTAGGNGAIIWEIGSGKNVALPHGGAVNYAEFSSDGSRVVTAGLDGRAGLWDNLAAPRLAIALQGMSRPAGGGPPTDTDRACGGPDGLLCYASLSEDRKWLATAGQDGSVSVFDLAKRAAHYDGQDSPLSTRDGDLSLRGHERAVLRLAFSPNGQRLSSASVDGSARIWNLKDGKTHCALSGHGDEVRQASWSRDGRRVATASHDHTARLWDARTCGLLAVYRAHSSWVRSAGFSPIDGRQLLTAGWDGQVRIWQTQSGQYEQRLLGHEDAVTDVAWSPAGTLLASSGMDDMLRIWDHDSGTQVDEISVPRRGDGGVRGVTWDREGKRLLTAGSDSVARLWNTTPLRQEGSFSHNGSRRLNDAAFSRDNTRVVTSGDEGEVKVWHAADAKNAAVPVKTFKCGEPRSARFSPDETRLLISCWGSTARVWTWQTDAELELGRNNFSLHFSAWSRDGSRLITAGAEVAVRNAATPDERLHTLSGHQLEVQHAIFSPTSDRVLTSSRDGTAKVWDADGTPLMTLRGHGGPIARAAFSPDGKKVATASDDGSVLIYSLDPKDLARMICSNLERAPEYKLAENEDVRQTCEGLQKNRTPSKVALASRPAP